MTKNKVPMGPLEQTLDNENYMQTKKVSVCNRKTQNFVLSGIEPPITKIIIDRQKHQIKYQNSVLHMDFV